MALYAIGDLHLSLSSNKPMEIFGDGWRDYVARIREGFSVLTEDDVTVLCGDLSWGMSLEESLEDFRFIDACRGRNTCSRATTTTGGTPPPKWSGSLRKTA